MYNVYNIKKLHHDMYMDMYDLVILWNKNNKDLPYLV